MSRIERVVAALPAGFAGLRAEADAEGFRNLARLEDDWAVGIERFADEGAALFAAYDGAVLAGVGGVTRDPAEATLLRMRRFYVHPRFRRRGHGEALAEAAIAAARGHAEVLLVHSSAFAMRFWDAAGFDRSTRAGITHERAL